MDSQNTTLEEFYLVGISERTNNANEMNPEKAIIGKTLAEYFGGQYNDKIQHRSQPGDTYCVYTNFDSDENGDYTYFVGEKVSSLEGQDLESLDALSIPASKYQKFTTESGKMPDVVISAWQEIWAMGQNDFSGKRKYIADFELYDEKANDPENTVVDIFIGVE